MNRDKRSLPLVKKDADKSMMPELLPAPPLRFAGAADPRERVRARLRQIGERAATLAAAVSLGAGCASDTHNADGGSGTGGGAGAAAQGGKAGDAGSAANGGASGTAAQGGAGASAGKGGAAGVAGSAGSNAGKGGAAGVAGSAGSNAGNGGAGAAGRVSGFAGYGVVDPLPMPFLCGAATAATVSGARWDVTGIIVAVQLPGQGFGTNGNTIQSVTVDPSSVQAMVTSAGTPGMLLLKPSLGVTWPANVMLDIAVNCMGNNGNQVWHVRVRLDTSMPAVSGDVPVQSLASGADAGT